VLLLHVAPTPHEGLVDTATDRAPHLVRFQKLAIATLALTLALVALGGAVRATGSGLACPDWPFCYGKVIPRQADIPPETNFTLVNVWLEHSHRLVASVVGLLIAVLLVWAIVSYRDRRGVLIPAIAAAVAVNVQAALGALVVLRLLLPELVTAHLGMAMVVIASLVLMAVNAGPVPARHGRPEPVSLAFARACAVITGLAFVQILVGGHVTGVRAGLVFGTNPLLYDGAIFPAITSEREAFHVAHRLLAYVLAGGVVYLCVQALRLRRARQGTGTWAHRDRWLVKLPMWAATLVVVQIGLGFANLLLRTPPDTVIPHLAVASWIWTVLVVLTVLAYRLAPRQAAGATAPDTSRAERASLR
jgi:heme a synthase